MEVDFYDPSPETDTAGQVNVRVEGDGKSSTTHMVVYGKSPEANILTGSGEFRNGKGTETHQIRTKTKIGTRTEPGTETTFYIHDGNDEHLPADQAPEPLRLMHQRGQACYFN